MQENDAADREQDPERGGATPWLSGPFQLLFLALLAICAALAAYFLLVA